MTDDLFRYYESELFFIRKLAQEFAAKHPAAAARLRLEPTRSADPHVERLIEAFALLAARVRNKLDDEFPELTDALLSVVYPHALAPVPSFATIQFEVHPAHAKPDGVRVPAGSPMRSIARLGDQYCKYRTSYPLTVWPLAVSEAMLHPPPFPPGLSPPAQANAALRLRLRGTAEVPIAAMHLDTLRVHLVGEPALIAPLYDLLFNHALEVAFLDPDNPRKGVTFPAEQVLRPVGFDPADGLLPYPENVFPGYRLLTEYFSYPAKFLYVDVAKLAEVRAATGAKGQLDVVVFLDRSHPRLEQMTKPDLFRLGCVPMANLFEVDAEPIQLTHAKSEYKIVPVLGQDLGHEVYAVREVTAAGAKGNPREYLPFYQFRHGGDRTSRRAFWHTARRPSLSADDRGTDVYLHLVDAAFQPATATDDAVVVRATCTNRDLPVKLPRVADAVRFEAEFAAAGLGVKCVRNPTPSQRPAGPRGRFWHLISHLNLNHLSLTDDGGLDALKGLLRLYDLTDPEADPQAAALARQSIEGVVGVGSRRAVAWLGGGDTGGLVRGVEVDLHLDEGKYVGSSGVLFATVMERFFALAVSVNSFSRLVAKYRQRDGILKRWPPRAGDKPLV